MLVCFVSAYPRGRALAVSIAEPAGAAEDIPGVAAFVLLADEPTAANETHDAFVGELLHEATGAADALDAGLLFMVLVDEPAAAGSTLNGTIGGGFAVPRSAIVAGPSPVFINSTGTARQANAEGAMVNL